MQNLTYLLFYFSIKKIVFLLVSYHCFHVFTAYSDVILAILTANIFPEAKQIFNNKITVEHFFFRFLSIANLVIKISFYSIYCIFCFYKLQYASSNPLSLRHSRFQNFMNVWLLFCLQFFTVI